MYITFKKVKYKNFLSTGNQFTEIDLTAVPKTVIHGTNGSGKTTFVDAIFFALFGKSFRKVKKDSVVNYITKKKTVVELEFDVRKDKYKIVRGIKPNKFEIYRNDELVPQDSTTTEYQRYLEKFIIHMNEKLFTQTVLLGSTNYTPFMLLSAADRRNVIESLLDIQIFSVMNELAKENNRELIRRYNNTEYEIEKAQISIDHLQNHIDSVKDNQLELISQNVEKITGCSKKIAVYKIEKEKYEKAILDFQEKRDNVGDKSRFDSMIKTIEQYKKQFETLITTNEKKIKFYQDNDTCSTCTQKISEEFKSAKVSEYQASNKKFDNGINKALDTIKKQEKLLQKYNEYQDLVDQNIEYMREEEQNILHELKSIETYENNIKEIKNSATTIKEENQIKQVQADKEKSEKDIAQTTEDITNYDTVLALLKDDGIKSRIVKTYIPVINKLIKKYLDILEFPIIFKFDESFNEYIKVRGRDEVTFPNLSEGERMRVNLSLIFAFRELAKLRNATHCNLIIFDEVADSSLDNTGWDSFLKILNDVCKDGNQNTFIISHKGEQIISKFDRDIKFAKKGGRFSEIIDTE